MQKYETVEQGGETSSLFYLTPSVPAEKMLANMRVNIARGLPEVKMCHPHSMSMSIAGGGPSLADTHQDLCGWVCAINGSLQYLIDQGLRDGVSYACGVCDAGAHIADLVPAHPAVRYYIASVCDPSLLDKLVSAGCDVIIWHITPGSMEDEKGAEELLNLEYDEWIAVGGGSTMGLRWIDVGYALGFRHFHLHGLDSSFRDTTHAYDEHQPVKGEIFEGGRRTKVAFLAQVIDFGEILKRLWTQDSNIEIDVHGDGLLQDEWKSFREANPEAFLPHPASGRALDLLKRLPEGPVCGVEVGVFMGRFSSYLLTRQDLFLTMVDPWEGHGASYMEGAPDWNAKLTQTEQDAFHGQTIINTRWAASRRKVIRARSLDAAPIIRDGSPDFVFIDGDHTYEAVKADLDAWWPKVKPGGWLCGHDYGLNEFGVERAVDEWAEVQRLPVSTGCNLTFYVQKPC